MHINNPAGAKVEEQKQAEAANDKGFLSKL